MPPLAGAIGTIGGIATGIGAVGGLFGGSKGRANTTTQAVDPATAAQQRFVQGLSRQGAQAAQGFQALGPTEAQMQALAGLQNVGAQFGNFATGGPTGGVGGGAQFSGDPGAFLNPFLGAIDQQARFDAGIASQNAAQQAEAEGAFGGSRAAIGQAAAQDFALRRAGNQRLQAFDLAQGRAGAAFDNAQNRQLQAGIANQANATQNRGLNLQGLFGAQQNFGQQFGQAEQIRQILQAQQNQGITGAGLALGFGQQGFSPFAQGTKTVQQGGPGFFQSLGGLGQILSGLGPSGGSNVTPFNPQPFDPSGFAQQQGGLFGGDPDLLAANAAQNAALGGFGQTSFLRP